MSPFASLSLRARLYVVAVTTIGGGVLLASIWEMMQSPIDVRWFVLVALTLLTGSITVKVPSVAATLSVSEVFVFSAVILFGWAAGTVVAALDGLVISLWLQRRKQPAYRVVFNGAAPALSIFIASWVYHALGAPTATFPDFQITQILIPLCGFAATYFLANTSLIAGAIALEQGISAFVVWRQNFMWLWLNFFSGASMAALLVSFGNKEGTNALSAIWIVLPLLGVSYFTYKTSMARIEDANRHVEQLNTLYLSTIETLAMAIDAKDQITHGHIRRVQTYAVSLAKAIGVTEGALIKAIEAAALLHDMGKLAVPEYILNKPGSLTPAEFERMKTHASVGADILSAIDFPYPVVPIVRHHHENWDGSGYPAGLKGADIPIGARVLSVVDCFDALTSDRPYRPRLSDEDALQIVRDRRGSMYDPLIVDTFLSLYRRLRTSDTTEKTSDGSLQLTEGQPLIAFPRLAAISASAGESRAMYRLIQRLAGRQSLSAAIEDVVEEVAALIPANVVAFYSPISEGSELEVIHVTGSHADWLKGRRVRLGERVIGWSASSGRSVLNADAQGEFGELARSGPSPLRSCLIVPVVSTFERLGVLAAFSSRELGFKTEDQRIVEAIIRHIAPVLERLKPEGSLTRLAANRASALELTPSAMIACRCAPSTVPGTEHLGVALSVIRRHLGVNALTQIIHDNDIFVGVDLSDADGVETIADGLRGTLASAGLIANARHVAVAVTPRDGTNLEHLLYSCRQRLSPKTDRTTRVH
jgi:putative nucleotidyltransferase with HDIG domain